jgi:hypothetical protein
VISQPLRVEAPIEESLEGVAIYGDATLTARNHVDMAASDLEQPLTIHFKGDLQSRTTAYRRPVFVVSSARSPFVGQYQLDFDGSRFSHTPVSVDVTTSSRIERVGSTRRGLVGRLIGRVAGRILSRNQGRINREVSRLIKQQIETEGDSFLTKAVAQLNEAARFEATLQAAFPGGGELSVVVSKTDAYLQALATVASEPDVALPAATLLGDAPIEIWLRAAENDPVLATIEKQWETAKSALVEVLPGFSEADAKAEQLVRRQVVDDWIVLQVGGSLADDQARSE